MLAVVLVAAVDITGAFNQWVEPCPGASSATRESPAREVGVGACELASAVGPRGSVGGRPS